MLPVCLTSLMAQDYPGGFEVIVVDNGSSDATASVAACFGATVIHFSKPGIITARQAGAAAATGGIVAQADADTVYPLGWLRRIGVYFATHPEAAAYGGIFTYEGAKRRVWVKCERFMRGFCNIWTTLVCGHPAFFSGANLAFRHDVFIMAGGYDPGAFSADQFGLVRRLRRFGRIGWDPTLVVVTSDRRLPQAAPIIFLQILRNIARAVYRFSVFILSSVEQRLVGMRLIRSRARLATFTSSVLAVSVLAYGYLMPSAQIFGKVYYHAITPQPMVALTFDDSPNEPYTSQILDVLDTYQVKATFFVVGKSAELYPDTVRRMVAEGDVIGNQTYSDRITHAFVGSNADILRAQDVIHSITGVWPHLYRPSHGQKSPWELEVAEKNNLVGVTWSVSANEQHKQLSFGSPDPEAVAQRIIGQVRPGAIIELHDGRGMRRGNLPDGGSITASALPTIIAALQARGYRFVTVPELLGLPAYNG
jgi:peptidoglycan/xylan/chitin deacetylase (PgdA/CDA1 family)